MAPYYSWWIYKYLKASFEERKLMRAKKLCDKKTNATNTRHYVLKDYNGKYQALTRSDVKRLQKLGIMDKQVNIYHLLRYSYYHSK